MTKTSVGDEPGGAEAGALWAYAYRMTPPQAEARMGLIRALLEEENGGATSRTRKWSARLVVEPQVTHVLVVSDSPELSHEGNRKLEAELKASGVDFSVTVPMLVKGPDRP